MKANRKTAFGLAALFGVVLAALGVLWLANAPLKPPTQTVNEAIPDDRIPH
jgi:hypothetical protein